MDTISLIIIKYLLTFFIIVLVPIYWKKYGAQNFLWLSDVGLFLTVLALWTYSSLLISIAAISILPLEILWVIDFFFRLLTRHNLFNIVNYMFDSQNSIFLRSLSLFHLALPPIWIWCLYLWGYDTQALTSGIILIWVVLIATYFFSDPRRNINWVFLPVAYKWYWVPEFLWLIFLLLAFPLIVLWPMHTLLTYLF